MPNNNQVVFILYAVLSKLKPNVACSLMLDIRQFLKIIFYVYECFTCTLCMPDTLRVKKASDSLELELGVVVSHHVGTGN